MAKTSIAISEYQWSSGRIISLGRRNRIPACLHAPGVEVLSEHQPESPQLTTKFKKLSVLKIMEAFLCAKFVVHASVYLGTWPHLGMGSWLLGLVVWFSPRVREVPASSPAVALCREANWSLDVCNDFGDGVGN